MIALPSLTYVIGLTRLRPKRKAFAEAVAKQASGTACRTRFSLA